MVEFNWQVCKRQPSVSNVACSKIIRKKTKKLRFQHDACVNVMSYYVK